MLGFIALAGFVVSLGVMRVRVLPKQKRALLEPGAFKEMPYTFFTLGLCKCYETPHLLKHQLSHNPLSFFLHRSIYANILRSVVCYPRRHHGSEPWFLPTTDSECGFSVRPDPSQLHS